MEYETIDEFLETYYEIENKPVGEHTIDEVSEADLKAYFRCPYSYFLKRPRV